MATVDFAPGVDLLTGVVAGLPQGRPAATPVGFELLLPIEKLRLLGYLRLETSKIGDVERYEATADARQRPDWGDVAMAPTPARRSRQP